MANFLWRDSISDILRSKSDLKELVDALQRYCQGAQAKKEGLWISSNIAPQHSVLEPFLDRSTKSGLLFHEKEL